MKTFLTIAALDSSGGAGIQQDTKVADRLGFWSLSAVTGITTQTFAGLLEIQPTESGFFARQLQTNLASFSVDCVKIGAICSLDILKIIVKALQEYKIKIIVWDPVFSPTNGSKFLDMQGIEFAREHLLPLVDLVTPNLQEFELLFPKKLPQKNVFLSGGHVDISENEIFEKLYLKGKVYDFRKKRRLWKYSHGTGCAFSTAVSCYLANGMDYPQAVQASTKFISNYFDNINTHL